jgi:hypothetical protein
VWLNSITSTTTDFNSTLKIFGTGKDGKMGTFIQMSVVSARSVKAFSAFPEENELLLRPNTRMRVKTALPSSDVEQIQKFPTAQLPPNVDLVVMEEILGDNS